MNMVEIQISVGRIMYKLLYPYLVMISIEKYGRFGNNVQQIINAIYTAEEKHITIIKYSLPQFKNFTINLKFEDTNSIKIHDTFFRIDYELSYKDKQRIAIQYLLPILIYSRLPTGFEDHYSSALFVHIRSGDIFINKGESKYTQPPLDYYITIFSKEKSRQFIILYEDDKNPVVNALKSLYPTAIFKCVRLDILITIFMNAQHIVNSVGTLIKGISYFNTTIKTFYSTINYHIKKDDISNMTIVSLPNYITNWENTENQRKIMIDYKGTVIET